MRPVITVGDMRRLEQAAVESGATYDALMEQAGAAVTAVLQERMLGDRSADGAVLVLCGNGNNGGDGFVIARLLSETQRPVIVVRVSGEPVTALAKEKETRLCGRVCVIDWTPTRTAEDIDACLPLSSCAAVVDAVYGIGFHGTLPPHQKVLFSRIRQMNIPVLAVDIPSGLHADNGVFDPDTLAADITVTFTACKPAVCVPSCTQVLGEVLVADIGIDPALTARAVTSAQVIEAACVKAMMPQRPADSHKGTFGRLLSVCGSYGMAGAAMLSGKAALRCGVGLLHMALLRSIYPIVAGQLWEAVYHPLGKLDDGVFSEDMLDDLCSVAQGKDAVLIGCGLSQHPNTKALLTAFLPMLKSPAVIDADGLNMLCEHILMLKAIEAPLVLTPHPAEMARLLKTTVTAVERDRPAAAKRLALETGAVVVLKGHRTLITSPTGEVYINVTGNSGMSTGGSGDVLSGMIAAFLAESMAPLHAAVCGVYLHGLAGDAAASRLSETAMLPTDMIDELGRLLSQFEKRE